VRAETHGGIMIHLRGLEATQLAWGARVFEASYRLFVIKHCETSKLCWKLFSVL